MKTMRLMAATLSLLLGFGVLGVVSDVSNHRYQPNDEVPLYANKVGPFHNPSETYRYFDLPYCSPAPVKDKSEALGEILNGDRLVDAPYKLEFRVDHDSKSVCKKKLTKEEVVKFRSAIYQHYYFQMYYDDLPVWGFIGKIDKEGKTDPNIEVEFMYSVKWKETETPFEKRMEIYSARHLETHRFSIINSCVTVLLLTGFLATILIRVLKNDFVKYARDEETGDDQEETGWKYVHGDVFRFPKNKSLLSASLGSGTQLFALAIFVFVLALVGVFYPYNRGALFTVLVVIYALTSGIAGYTATSFYWQLEGTNWGIPLWRIYWFIHLCILLCLLPYSVKHVRIYANILLLWLHGLHLLWFLPHARHSRFLCFTAFCSSHLRVHQV